MPLSYSRNFYQTLNEGVKRSAEIIVPLVLDVVKPQSVIDIGCGTGTWLSVFQKYGVEDILGFDLTVSLEVAEHLEADFPLSIVHPREYTTKLSVLQMRLDIIPYIKVRNRTNLRSPAILILK